METLMSPLYNGKIWSTIGCPAEASIKRILRNARIQRSVVLMIVKELHEAHLLCATAGSPAFAIQRLASLLVASRVEMHVTWASHPLSLVDRPSQWNNAA